MKMEPSYAAPPSRSGLKDAARTQRPTMKRVITSVNGGPRRSGGWRAAGGLPCPAKNLTYSRAREKDDSHFLKRVATELWAGWCSKVVHTDERVAAHNYFTSSL